MVRIVRSDLAPRSLALSDNNLRQMSLVMGVASGHRDEVGFTGIHRCSRCGQFQARCVQHSVRRQIGIQLLQGHGHRDPAVLMIVSTEQTRSPISPITISKLSGDIEDLPAVLTFDFRFYRSSPL